MRPVSGARRARLAVVATHPIQYHEPLYRALAADGAVEIQVNYVRIPNDTEQGVGFGVPFQWDIPLREGYDWSVLGTRALLTGYFRRRLSAARAWLRQSAPDALLVTGWNEWPLVQAALAARSEGIPVIVRGETSGLMARSALKRVVHRALLRLYDAMLVIGKANRRFYAGLDIPGDRLFDAPYFVDNQRFFGEATECTPQRSALRSRWRIPEDACCFLFAGKLQPKKRILNFLRAIQAAAQEGGRVHGLVVGTGEQSRLAEDMVRGDQLPASFAGFLNQSEMARAYVASDALVLPSDYGETWGLVVNEAMACGRPAFVSDRVGCGPDLIRPGQTGEVFPFGDTRALAELMRRYAGQPAELGRMGAAAQRLVMEDYSVEKSVDGVLKAVEFVLAKGRGG